METEAPFALYWSPHTPKRLVCVFPPEPQNHSAETALLRDDSRPETAPHHIEIAAYVVWVRFENAFPLAHMLARTTHCDTLPGLARIQCHSVMLGEHARLFRMAARSLAQLECHLDAMKQHLLPGTFDDDEEGRHCEGITTTVRCARPFNKRALKEALAMTREPGCVWMMHTTLAALIQLAALSQRELDRCFSVDCGDNPCDRVGDGSDEDDEDDGDVVIDIALIDDTTLLVSVEGNRQPMLVAHCALHRIIAQCYAMGTQ